MTRSGGSLPRARREPGPHHAPRWARTGGSSPAALPSAPLVHACALTSHSSPVLPRFALPEPLKPRSPGEEAAAESGASRLGPGWAPSPFSVAMWPARAHAVGTRRKQAGIRVSRPLGWEGADRFRSTAIPLAGAEDGGRVLSCAEDVDTGRRAGLGSYASHTGFCSLRLSRSTKSPTVLRALTTQKQNSTPQGRGPRAPPRSSRQPPPPTRRHLCPGTMRAARAPRPPMLTAGPSGKPGSRARPPPRWAGPVGGSSWTPGPPSPAGAFSEGSSTRTSPPWGASQLRTLRRPGRPRLAPRASPTGRWCVREGLLECPCGGFSRGAGVRPPPRTISGWGRWFRRFQEHGGLFLVECAARQSCYLSGAEREMGGSTNPCRSVLSLSADSRGLSVLPLAQRARSGAEGASDEDWAAGQLWR